MNSTMQLLVEGRSILSVNVRKQTYDFVGGLKMV